MTEMTYLVLNASVLPVWAAMIFAPRAALTERVTATPLVPLLYAVIYASLLGLSTAVGGEGDMASLAGLRLSFERDSVLLLAWVHYLCFDMVVGMWVLRDAKRLAIGGWWVGPCLLFTLLLGPIGFGAYVLLRWRRVGATGW